MNPFDMQAVNGGAQAPEQNGGDQMAQIAQAAQGMLQEGAQPEQVVQQLTQSGIPQDVATTAVQGAMGATPGAAPEQGPTPDDLMRVATQAAQEGANPQEVMDSFSKAPGVDHRMAADIIKQAYSAVQNSATTNPYAGAGGADDTTEVAPKDPSSINHGRSIMDRVMSGQ